jgi:hypothetical protein
MSLGPHRFVVVAVRRLPRRSELIVDATLPWPDADSWWTALREAVRAASEAAPGRGRRSAALEISAPFS